MAIQNRESTGLRRTTLLSCLLIWLMIFSVSSFAGTPLQTWQAGAARVDITPDVQMNKVPLGGYAARRAAPATGVHDPVYARALVLSNGSSKIVLVSIDLCFLPANIRTEVARRLMPEDGIDISNLFLCATHTHTAPDPLAMHAGNTFTKLKGWTLFDGKLLDFTASRIAKAIRDANSLLVPASFAVQTGDAVGTNRNRRGDIAVDPALSVMKVLSADGKNIATLINFAAHPTLYDDKMMEISADWPGVTTGDLEKNGGVCLFLNGAEGDASPNGVDDVQGADKVTTYGHRVATLVKAELEQAKILTDPTIAMWATKITLPPRKPNGQFYVAASSMGATFAQAQELVNGLMPTTSQVTFVQIGELLLMGFPCEPCATLGLEAKRLAKEAGYKVPAVVALTNDWLAYALTPEQYRAGKYEALMSFYGDGLGPTLLEAIKAGVKRP